MVGVNHEMACELLWREFPTDQRGSYFRQFWDVADVVNHDLNKSQAEIEQDLLDIERLHQWEPASELGSHPSRSIPEGGDADDSRLVLVVRGDLLKKYPTVVIYAQKAMWATEGDRQVRVLDPNSPTVNLKHPIFKAEIEPDIRFLGFDLPRIEAEGSSRFEDNDPGWFFVLQERPGEPRFGFDNLSDESPAVPAKWDDFAWEHLTDFGTLDFINLNSHKPIPDSITEATDSQFVWASNAADMAYILYQVPVMVAFHAADMLA
jgi:hypothetical protein